MRFARFPVRRVEASPAATLDTAVWPATIPAVRQLLRDGLDLGRTAVLIGENGAGRSTLIEAVAIAFGLSPEGGSPNTLRATRPSESPLHEHLTPVRYTSLMAEARTLAAGGGAARRIRTTRALSRVADRGYSVLAVEAATTSVGSMLG